jgi:hypothetical protein
MHLTDRDMYTQEPRAICGGDLGTEGFVVPKLAALVARTPDALRILPFRNVTHLGLTSRIIAAQVPDLKLSAVPIRVLNLCSMRGDVAGLVRSLSLHCPQLEVLCGVHWGYGIVSPSAHSEQVYMC